MPDPFLFSLKIVDPCNIPKKLKKGSLTNNPQLPLPFSHSCVPSPPVAIASALRTAVADVVRTSHQPRPPSFSHPAKNFHAGLSWKCKQASQNPSRLLSSFVSYIRCDFTLLLSLYLPLIVLASCLATPFEISLIIVFF